MAASTLALAGLMAPAAVAQQVFGSDVIVEGSLCTGNDCQSPENFSFDTIRLKQNNLRIHFDDTSSSGTFPTNDWRLVANDQNAGGANLFAIEDATAGNRPFVVKAGAGSNAMVIDDVGNVGIGTGAPALSFHVVEGNSPSLRLEQDGSAGFAAQSWDIAGNETNFFVRDVSNGSRLPFKIKPGAPSNALFVAANGSIGFGTDNPENELHIVRDSGNVGFQLATQTRTGPDAMRFSLNAAADEFRIKFVASGDTELALDEDGNLTIAGNLITTGGGGACTAADPCDRVFDAQSYTVPSIEEHASQMWAAGHLPAVGPTGPGQPIDMTEKMLRMLNELEHAHIYIEQLHQRIEALEERL